MTSKGPVPWLVLALVFLTAGAGSTASKASTTSTRIASSESAISR